MKTTWELVKIGSKRALYGIRHAGLVASCIVVLAWIVPRVINLLATEPVQLRDPAASAILAWKVVIIFWAFVAGLGTPD